MFTMALVLAGLAGSFGVEADNALQAFGATPGSSSEHPGPIHERLPIPESAIGESAVCRGDAGRWLRLRRASDRPRAQPTDANLFGVEPGKVGFPVPAQGRQPRSDSEAMVDDALPYGLGQHIVVGWRGLQGRRPAPPFDPALRDPERLYHPARRAEAALWRPAPRYRGAHQGHALDTHHPTYRRLNISAEVKQDMTRPLAKARQVVAFIEIFLWLIAACIIGSVVYVSALEKTRDFAVLKATGGSNGQLMVDVGTSGRCDLGRGGRRAAVLANLLAPVFPIIRRYPAVVNAAAAACWPSCSGSWPASPD